MRLLYCEKMFASESAGSFTGTNGEEAPGEIQRTVLSRRALTTPVMMRRMTLSWPETRDITECHQCQTHSGIDQSEHSIES